MTGRMFTLAAICFAGSCVMVNISNDLLEVREESHNLREGALLSFENTNGDLELKEWSNDYVAVETRIYGDSSRGVPEDLVINIDETADELSYTVDYPGGMNFCSVDFMVQIPEHSGYLVKHTTVNGETLIIADIDAFVESVNGDIDIQVLSTSGLMTTNGDIKAILDAQELSFTLQTVNGDLELELSEALGIEVETLNGDIHVDRDEVESGFKVSGSGGETAVIETVNGDIIVRRMND